VLSFAEVQNEPHITERETFYLDGDVLLPSPAPRFSRTPGARGSTAPRVGQDTEAVLADFGFSPSAIALLGTFMGIAGMYVQLSADFLAATQVLVYVGGTLTLILFAVMLTARIEDIRTSNSGMNRGLAGGPVLIVLLGLGKIAAFTAWPSQARPQMPATARLGHAFLTDYALPFDRVQPADHENLGQVSPELKAILKERSAGRIKESKDFTKLAKEIEQFKTWKARKKVPLNEKELREQFTKNAAEKLDQKANELDPEPPSTETAYKFKRNFTNKEILQIMEDLIQGEKLVSKR